MYIVHIIDIRSLLAMLEAKDSLYFFKINFIEFDFLGTYIRNKRKNPPS